MSDTPSERNSLCVCRSGKTTKNCCERIQKSKKFKYALHEVGHAALLPAGEWTHSSLCPTEKCPECKEEMKLAEEEPVTLGVSKGHTCSRFSLSGEKSFIYAVAGGATEVACGLSMSEIVNFHIWGEYPSSMGSDFAILEADIKHYHGNPEEYRDEIRSFFQIAVEHLRPFAGKLREIAIILAKNQLLTSAHVTFGFVQYESLLTKLQT